MQTTDMTPTERLEACERFTRWVELRAQMRAEWAAIVARKRAQVSL